MALETGYGVLLFERSTRTVRLTQEGYKLLELCRPIFDGLRDVEDFLRLQNTRTVRISSVTYNKISEFLAVAYRSFPKLRFELDIMPSTQVLDAVLRRDCDFGLLTLTDPPAEIRFFKVAQGKIIALVPPDHPWRQRSTISIRELQDARIVIASPAGQSRRHFDDSLDFHGVTVSVVQTVDSNEVLRDLVRRGVGIGIMGYTGLADQLADHYLDFQEESLKVDVHFACRRERLRTAVFEAVYETARAHLVEA